MATPPSAGAAAATTTATAPTSSSSTPAAAAAETKDPAIPTSTAGITTAAPLFPPIEPYYTGELKVDDLHTLHYELSGSQATDAKIAIGLHGGPGSGLSTYFRQLFDPAVYRLVQFDQRGSGKSRPYGSLERNTTAHLIGDIELLRKTLGIKKWLVFGGSWGSTLALAYTQFHPTSVKALIVYGVYGGGVRENETFMRDAYPQQYPEEYERLKELIPETEWNDLLSAYYRRLVAPGPTVYDLTQEQQNELARRWCRFESVAAVLKPDVAAIERALQTTAGTASALAKARIECHYFVHGCFLARPNQLVEDAKIFVEHKIPGAIVHGRFDLICQPRVAYELYKVWGSELSTLALTFAGHASREEATSSKLLEAVARFKDL